MNNKKNVSIAKTKYVSPEQIKKDTIIDKYEKMIVDGGKDINKRVININDITFEELAYQLNKSVRKSSRVIFRGWRNKNAELDEEYQRFILDMIGNLRNINKEFMNFKAEVILTEETLDLMINNKRTELVLAFEKNAYSIEKERKRIELDKKRDTFGIEKIEEERELERAKHQDELHRIEHGKKLREVEYLKAKAEANIFEAKSEKEKAVAILINDTVKNIDINSMPDEFRFFIVNAIINPAGHDYTEDFIKQKIKDFVIKQEELKTEQMEDETIFKKEKQKASVYEFREVGNSDKNK